MMNWSQMHTLAFFMPLFVRFSSTLLLNNTDRVASEVKYCDTNMPGILGRTRCSDQPNVIEHDE